MTIEDKLIYSYLAYIFLVMIWLVFIWGGTAYLVFWRGECGAWFLLTAALSSPIMPHKWHSLITGKNPDDKQST